MKMQPYKTVDEYLANFSGATRSKLDTIRKMIKEAVPESKEKISYGIPTATIDDKNFIYFAGYGTHVAIYPIPSAGDSAFQKELDIYRAGKGTLRFALDKPLPLPLIRKVILAKHDERKDIYKK